MTPTCKEMGDTEDTYYTLNRLYCLMKFFCLECTVRRNALLVTNWSWLRSVSTAAFLGALTSASLYWKIKYFYSDLDPSIMATDASESIYDYFQYIIDLYFVHRYGRCCKLEYYNYYKNIDAILDFRKYLTIRKGVNRLVIGFIFAWFCSNSLDFVGWTLSYGWERPLVWSVVYIFIITKILTFLDMASNVLNFECRIAAMCDVLECYYKRAPCSETLAFADPIQNKKWIHSMPEKEVSDRTMADIVSVSTCKEHEMKLLSKCYLLLAEQCHFVNCMFGVRILLSSVSLLIDMIRFINIAVRILTGTQQTTYNSYGLPTLANMLRFFVYAALLAAIAHHCERSYRQRDRMLYLLDNMLINKDFHVASRYSLEELRNLVISRSLDFHVTHFFRLDYSLLCSITSVVVTYTIILTQIHS